MNYQLAFDSFIGSRSENQDAVLNLKIAEDIFLVGIADGMGGVKGGKLASSLTVESIIDYAQSLSLDQFENENLKNILAACYDIANFCIQKAVEREPEYRGMGTTLSLLLICGDYYVWSNIGDSRIYSLDSENIEQITLDHTYVQEMATDNGGVLTEEMKGKYEHFLTKCVDGSGELPDIFPKDKMCQEIHKSANFLLCSDGLILDKAETDSKRLRQLVMESNTVQDAVSELISYAYSEGSKDNISVGVVRISEQIKDSPQFKASKRKINRFNLAIYLVLTVLVIASGGIFISSLNNGVSGTTDSTRVTSSNQLPPKGGMWMPLQEVDFRFPLTSTAEINWAAYPKKKLVKYYHMVILFDDQIVFDKYLKNTSTYYPVSELNLLEGGPYTLMIDAIIEDNKRIEGNTVSFKYQPATDSQP